MSAYRTYLRIPYARKEEAKEYCRRHNLLRIAFDDQGRRQWYYPSDRVPSGLSEMFPVIDVVKVGGSGNDSTAIWAWPPTPEQEEFVRTEPTGSENLLVVRAFAGAAKTTSLKAYARSRPNARLLYLAFGNANAKEARASFPTNTTCSTVHALAHKWLPEILSRKVVNDLTSDVVVTLLGHQPTQQNLALGTYVRTLLNGFWASSDAIPLAHHLGASGDLLAGSSWALGESIDTITECAQKIWELMTNPEHPAPLPHEAYLKLYALSRPVWDYDYVLLDEAQDTNPVVEEMVFQQPAKKIIVGDPHQNVYTFRRARDILTPRVDAGSPCLHLTNSFRFGPEIAEVANLILRTFKGEQFGVVGRGRNTQLHEPDGGRWNLDVNGNYKAFTWLARTNAILFDAAVEIVGILEAFEQVTGRRAPRIAFIGTSPRLGYSPFHAYKFGRLIDLVRLAAGERERIHDPFIARYKSIQELWKHVTSERTADPDLAAAIRIYRRYQKALPVLIKKITDRCTNPADPSVWVRFTTAHKAKGLEWDRVRLTADFVELAEFNETTHEIEVASTPDDEEINLLYVAVTRAKEEIELNAATVMFLVKAGRRDLVPNALAGMTPIEHQPISWKEAVLAFGGDPDAIKAEIMRQRAAAAAQRTPAS